MKRIFTLIALIGMMATAYAQRPVATLSHEGKLTMFTSGQCFVEAHDAAVDGDTIYLSNGTFTNLGLEVISKRVTFIGNGRRTHIAGELDVRISNNTEPLTSSLFDGVYIEKLTLYGQISGVEVKNSRIQTLYYPHTGYTRYDTKIDRCEIYNLIIEGSVNGIEAYNSKIASISGELVYGEGIRLLNCNVSVPKKDFGGYCSSSNVWLEGDGDTLHSDALYDYCTICYDYSNGNGIINNANIRNCYDAPYQSGYPFDKSMNYNHEIYNLEDAGYLGIDGTRVGIYGGEWFPYTEEPSLPTVDKEKSTVEYDATENKLKVNITVTAN